MFGSSIDTKVCSDAFSFETGDLKLVSRFSMLRGIEAVDLFVGRDAHADEFVHELEYYPGSAARVQARR